MCYHPDDEPLYLVQRAIFGLLSILSDVREAALEDSPHQLLANALAYLDWEEKEWGPNQQVFWRVTDELQKVRLVPFSLNGHHQAFQTARSEGTASKAALELAYCTVQLGAMGDGVVSFHTALEEIFTVGPGFPQGTSGAIVLQSLREEAGVPVEVALPVQTLFSEMVATHRLNLVKLANWLRESLADFDYAFFAREAEYEFTQALRERRLRRESRAVTLPADLPSGQVQTPGQIPQTTPPTEDPTAYRPAREFLDKDRFQTYKAIRNFLKDNPSIRWRKPSTQRLEIHSGDWRRCLAEQTTQMSPYDCPAVIVDAVLEKEQRQQQIRQQKARK